MAIMGLLAAGIGLERKTYVEKPDVPAYYDIRTKLWYAEMVEQTLKRAALKTSAVNCRNCGAPKLQHICEYCRT